MNEAKRRMKGRDIQDWPIAATALALNSAIWTEDKDFFGSGFPTWTTNKIHIFFEMS
jgi:predicted nucleic acid-binding protein